MMFVGLAYGDTVGIYAQSDIIVKIDQHRTRISYTSGVCNTNYIKEAYNIHMCSADLVKIISHHHTTNEVATCYAFIDHTEPVLNTYVYASGKLKFRSTTPTVAFRNIWHLIDSLRLNGLNPYKQIDNSYCSMTWNMIQAQLNQINGLLY